MTGYRFLPELLVRTPLLSAAAWRRDYAGILNRNDFRTALFFASRSFYNELSKKAFVYEELSEKQKQSVNKYINRAIFRSTPFGMFSSVAVVNWGKKADHPLLLEEPHADIRLDFTILHEISENAFQHKRSEDYYFLTNASAYPTSIDIRFVKKTVSGNKTRFSMVSVGKNRVLMELLKFCKRPRTYSQLFSFLLQKGAAEDEANSFLSELVSEQLLVSEFAPNLTGEDYLEMLSERAPDLHLLRDIEAGMKKIKRPGGCCGEKLNRFSCNMDDLLSKPDSTNYFYCVSERRWNKGGLDAYHQQSLSEGLHCLNRLSSLHENRDLQAFRQAFQKRYEDREVPLLEVLDSQFGIGYGGLDDIKADYGFSSGGYNRRTGNIHSEQSSNDAAAWFLNQWNKQNNSSTEILISDENLAALENKSSSGQLPPSIAVLFRTLDDKVFIESAGGVSALGLVGRFSFLDGVSSHARAIALKEQALNPNVLFAEIAHVCDLHTANINRRQHFYDYEIPILTGSTLPQKNQIPLNDLMISVRGDKVVLRSARHNKIVIPRLSSAFNYTKNDLPVFRFLCDLQSQGLKTAFVFSLPSLVPGLKFYPRLVYKSCILQLAEWHFGAGELPPPGPGAVELFDKLALSRNLPECFSYAVGDHFLVFDRGRSSDVALFLREVKDKQHVVLKEFPFLSNAIVRTTGGEPLLGQYLATLYLEGEVYKNEQYAGAGSPSQTKTADRHWLYFKVYCHPLSSDILLRRYLLPLVGKLKKAGLICQWFWLRYNDPDNHLRIRVKARSGCRQKVLSELLVYLEGACKDKLASHFISDTYQPELQRYSPGLIGRVEQVFEASSELIGGWLMDKDELSYEDKGVIIEAACATNAMLDGFKFGMEQKAAFCRNSFEQFFIEFHSSKQLRTEMEKLYRELEPGILEAIGAGTPACYGNLRKAISDLARDHCEKRIQTVTLESLAADVIHLHQNRLFVYEQRYFEMIQYFVLYRVLYKQLYKSGLQLP